MSIPYIALVNACVNTREMGGGGSLLFFFIINNNNNNNNRENDRGINQTKENHPKD